MLMVWRQALALLIPTQYSLGETASLEAYEHSFGSRAAAIAKDGPVHEMITNIIKITIYLFNTNTFIRSQSLFAWFEVIVHFFKFM
jgi:hypothetical protein